MFVPHYRVSMLGRLGGGTGPEQFSMSFALGPSGGNSTVPALQPNDAVWNDLADDCAEYFGQPNACIHPDAQLQLVKVAHIGQDGKYLSAPVERIRVQNGTFVGGVRHPNQVAMAITLHTEGDLRRIKGRWYQPLLCVPINADGRVDESAAEAIEAVAQGFVNNVNNQPGLDVLDLRVSVASQGRFNKNGTQRVAPGNHVVTAVSVGRVPDTQRRRRNKLAEVRTSRPVS